MLKRVLKSASEGALFLAIVTWVGGYIDAYTYIVRGGVFANNQTGNVAKLGIVLAEANWMGAFDCLVPIIATILGATASEWNKSISKKLGQTGDWRKTALCLEIIALLIVGFIPLSVPNWIVNGFISFIAGFQLCLFRNWCGNPHNTTISTGNLRTLGQLFFGALSGKAGEGKKTLAYASILFSFTLGCVICTLLCKVMIPVQAIWICSLVLAIPALWLHLKDKKIFE